MLSWITGSGFVPCWTLLPPGTKMRYCAGEFPSSSKVIFEASKSRKSKDRVGTVKMEEARGVWIREWPPIQFTQRDWNATRREMMGEEWVAANTPMNSARLLFKKDRPGKDPTWPLKHKEERLRFWRGGCRGQEPGTLKFSPEVTLVNCLLPWKGRTGSCM